MLIMKYNNKCIYTKFDSKDLKQVSKETSSNTNKVEIIMNNIGGKVFEDEIDNIVKLHDIIQRYHSSIRIIIYTMNSMLHRIVKNALLKRSVQEDAIIRLYAGRYDFYDKTREISYCFFKSKYKLELTIRNNNHSQVIMVAYYENYFDMIINPYSAYMHKISVDNKILYDIICNTRIKYYPITEYNDLVKMTDSIYEQYQNKVYAAACMEYYEQTKEQKL